MDGKRVAVVDDDPIFLEHVSTILAQYGGMRVIKLTNGDELFKTLDRQEISCIVLDYDLGNQTGLALGQSVQQKYADAPPIVMLTGQGSERTATKAFRIGFADYVSKRNLDQQELIAAIRGAIFQNDARQARVQETERLRQHQRQDSLTGLYSASYVAARLNEVATSRSGTGFTLMAIRIENFAELRLRIGHAASERVFRDFAKRLSDIKLDDGFIGHLATYDLVCVFERVMAPATISATCQRLAAEARFSASHEGSRVEIAARVSAAGFPEDGNDAHEVIRAALSGLDEPVKPKIPTDAAPAGVDKDLAGTTDDEMPPHKQRAHQRFRVLKKGKVVINGLNTVLDCSVRNVSESGAQIRVDGYFAAPSRFQLLIVGSGDPRWVVTRWQVGTDIGVQYQEPEL